MARYCIVGAQLAVPSNSVGIASYAPCMLTVMSDELRSYGSLANLKDSVIPKDKGSQPQGKAMAFPWGPRKRFGRGSPNAPWSQRPLCIGFLGPDAYVQLLLGDIDACKYW